MRQRKGPTGGAGFGVTSDGDDGGTYGDARPYSEDDGDGPNISITSDTKDPNSVVRRGWVFKHREVTESYPTYVTTISCSYRIRFNSGQPTEKKTKTYGERAFQVSALEAMELST